MAATQINGNGIYAPQPSETKEALKPNPQKKNVSPALSLFAGGVAGGFEAAVTYPFEFTKTRAQLPDAKGVRSSNMFSMIARVAREEGPQAIYTGCSTLVVGTAFKAGVRFLTFDTIKNLLSDENGRLTPTRGIVAGMAAGCVESVVAVTPTERVKTALIDDAQGQRRYRGGVHAARCMVREQGLRSLYGGLLSTTAKQSTTSAVRMGSYNVLKETGRRYNLPHNSAMTFLNGAVAGTVAVYASQPLDSVKTRVQSANGSRIPDAVRDIISERGLTGLWRGSTMRLGRLVLSGGIVFSVYEAVVDIFTGQKHPY